MDPMILALAPSMSHSLLFLNLKKRLPKFAKSLRPLLRPNYSETYDLIKSELRHTVCLSLLMGDISKGENFMNKSSGKVTFVAAAVFIFLTTMYFVSGGVLNMTTLTSIPIILSAEGIVFVLLYATTYHSEAEGTSEHH